MKGLYVIVAFFILIFGIIQLQDASADADKQKKEFVQYVCDSARQEINGKSEEECAIAQDHTNTEFLCGAWNGIDLRHCWVENK